MTHITHYNNYTTHHTAIMNAHNKTPHLVKNTEITQSKTENTHYNAWITLYNTHHTLQHKTHATTDTATHTTIHPSTFTFKVQDRIFTMTHTI